MMEQYLRRRSDLGIWSAVSTRIMTARNSLEQKSVRSPQPWFVLFSSSVLAAIIAFVYFNLWH
jgi:hypothetical protein